MIRYKSDLQKDASSDFLLRVEGANGVVQDIVFCGISEDQAVRRVVSMGGRVLLLQAAQSNLEKPVKSKKFSILLFSQELLALLDAGLNIGEALNVIYAKERNPSSRALMAHVLEYLRRGQNLSDVLLMWPENFPEVYVATIRAAEKTGDISRALGRYIDYEQQFEALRKKVTSAAIYPAMLLVVGGFVTLFLLGYVVPRFSTVYESSARDIPWLSMMLMGFGKLIYQHWQFAVIVLICSFVFIGWIATQPHARAWALDRLLNLPWLRRKVEEFRLARFYRAVSLLLSSGIPLSKAMGMVAGLLSPSQQIKLGPCRQAIEQGQSLSFALVNHGLADQVAESLIKVGERSGHMAEMLERTARFADADFSRWIDWASRLLEPLLMAIIGLVIGAVVVLMYLPIFELAGSLQ